MGPEMTHLQPQVFFFLLTLLTFIYKNNYTTIASATVSPNCHDETMRNGAQDVYGVPVSGPMFVLFSFNNDNKGRGIYLDLFILVIIILYINNNGCSFFHFLYTCGYF